MTAHTVASFDGELAALSAVLLDMGQRAAHSLEFAAEAMEKSDAAIATQLIAADRAIDDLQHQIEEKAVGIIARRQPVASDLRQLIACLRVANDFERIGDLSKNVAKRTLAILDAGPIGVSTSGLSILAARVQEALDQVIEALRTRDETQAMSVWERDHEIDAQHTSLFRELLTYMMEDPRNIGACTHLLFCAKNLERIGDHATNIAETIHYMVTGRTVIVDRPRADVSSSKLDDIPLPAWKG